MALDMSKIKSRLNSLSSKQGSQKNTLIWKPNPGKQTIRIVPYVKNLENPFIELKFHYNLNGKTYLSPDSFNRPDPIVEFSEKLKRSGDKEQWKVGKKFEPKMRTFAPVIVRGEEDLGVRFWGFGKQVYEAILSIIADPDYGDITDLAGGHDIVVEFKTAEDTGKDFPETSIIVKPKSTPAVDPTRKDLIEKIKNQADVLELFPELSYAELKNVMDQYLRPEQEEESVEVTTDSTEESAPKEEKKAVATQTVVTQKTTSPTTAVAKENTEDIADAFDKLFAKK